MVRKSNLWQAGDGRIQTAHQPHPRHGRGCGECSDRTTDVEPCSHLLVVVLFDVHPLPHPTSFRAGCGMRKWPDTISVGGRSVLAAVQCRPRPRLRFSESRAQRSYGAQGRAVQSRPQRRVHTRCVPQMQLCSLLLTWCATSCVARVRDGYLQLGSSEQPAAHSSAFKQLTARSSSATQFVSL